MALDTMAVILAAGEGTRLRPLTENRPKCLLEVGGRTLLDYQLTALAKSAIENVVVVTGHCRHQVESHCAGRARTVYDPEYRTWNNLHSLWSAAGEIPGQDCLCLHGDVLFDPTLLQPCLSSRADVCVLLDRTLVEETMKARVEDSRVLEIGKHLSPERCFGTFVGIARFRPVASAALPSILRQLVEQESHRGSYFTACLPALAAQGFETGYALTEGRAWIEIDTPEDLERASQKTAPHWQGC